MGELVGYMRVSKVDGSQTLDLQRDALLTAGVDTAMIYEDRVSGAKDHRPGLEACLKALRPGDTLCIWKLDRLGRNLSHLVAAVYDLSRRKIGFRVLSGQSMIDTNTATGELMLAIFAGLASFERSLIRERTLAGLSAARARGHVGGRRAVMTPAKVRLLQAAMGKPETVVSDLCKEIGVSRQTLYRYVGPDGSLREEGFKLLG